MRAFGLLLLPVLTNLVSAQQTYTIDPDSVDSGTRDTWCTNQEASCPLICSQTSANNTDTEANSCDPSTLDYSCVCDNGISPNASQWSQTIPYYVCTEWGNQCVTNCNGDSTCQYDCRANHPCGAQSPTRVNVTSTSSSTSKTATSTGGGQSTNSAGATIYSGLGGDTSSTGTAGHGSGAPAALELGQAYGLLVVIASMFGGFALLL